MKYVAPEMEIVRFETIEVLAASSQNPAGCVVDCPEDTGDGSDD